MRDLQAIILAFQINLKMLKILSWIASSPNFQSRFATFKKCLLYAKSLKSLSASVSFWSQPTRYLSVDTLTRIRSSPMRTFSPSDLCLDAGWIVHQQASPAQAEPRSRLNWYQLFMKRQRADVNSSSSPPVECSWRPTSNDNLSVREREVFRQVRYWREWWDQSFGVITHYVLIMSASTNHVTEGVAKEDGMTIEKGPVSTPLAGLTGKAQE